MAQTMQEMLSKAQYCPKCGAECVRDEVNVGVGWRFGPWGCPSCRWSESEQYDLSDDCPSRRKDGTVDQYGGLHPNRGESMGAVQIAKEEMEKDAEMTKARLSKGEWVMSKEDREQLYRLLALRKAEIEELLAANDYENYASVRASYEQQIECIDILLQQR